MVQSGWVSIKQRGIEMGQVIRQCLELGHTELELLAEERVRGRERGGTHTGGQELMVGSQ
jgi:hypothetical protein